MCKWGWLTVVAACLGCAVAFAAPPSSSVGPDWAPRLLTAEEAAEGFYPLFNGRDLDGWWIRGANKHAFAVKDAVLATTGEGGGDWIFSSREYENFVLRYEYRVFKQDDNSGVALRATKTGNPAFSGMEIQVLHPEKEPREGSAGALYGSVKPSVVADKPFGEWNAVEVLCEGSRVRTIMNGQKLYDIDLNTFDSPDTKNTPLNQRAKSGHIAIQDYGKHVEFRKIRIRPLPGGQGWRSLFNGHTLDGWTVSDNAPYEIVEGGVLRLQGGSGAGHGTKSRGVLRTKEKFGDYELRLMVKANANTRSDVIFYRPGVKSWSMKFELPIDNHSPAYCTGSLYRRMPALELRSMDDAWMQMHVIARGANIQVAINGKTVADYVARRIFGRTPGGIGLQFPDANGVVEFKDIEVKPLH